ncbi:IS1595 family transposase [Pontibacter beigongshangensis]|uniref:IS1595 family transposase n=1 Tax=Pontibacter beigongshangensis TaxID=2574733 RepID=UPI00165093A8|nr:IS1595 family transposase [Pontibacter beigongshangensis]
MEKRYQSLSLFEFQSRFPNDSACREYLAQLKWSQGYACVKCGKGRHCAGSSPLDRQCTSCGHTESPTAGTLFHGCKFPLLKAFYIVYYVSTCKSGMSSTELSRKLELRQKTCWLFRQKVMKAMESSGHFPMAGKVDVDETFVGGQDEQATGRSQGSKSLVVVAIERKGRGVARMYGKVIEKADRKNLKAFMGEHISPEAQVRTDGWSGYQGLEEVYPRLVREKSEKKGKNFPQLHRSIMMFKAWLRGVHHSVRYLQAYINEYTYRFNRHKMKEGIFENLLKRMVAAPPHPYKMVIA